MADVEHISRKGNGVPVSWFPVPEEPELPEGLRGLFRKAREKVGFVPNVFRAYSFRERFRIMHRVVKGRGGIVLSALGTASR